MYGTSRWVEDAARWSSGGRFDAVAPSVVPRRRRRSDHVSASMVAPTGSSCCATLIR